MKKEEFLTILRKNLSVLEEGEVRDIVEEYEQHIDMKMKEGLSEEAAIKDFGDLKELTTGILEAYHVKADYNSDSKKNIDFNKVKEESKKATEKATDALGKGAGALGKGAGFICKKLRDAGRWIGRGCKKAGKWIIKPFVRMSDHFRAGKQKASGKGIFGKLWMLILSICSLLWKVTKWCLRFTWNSLWLFTGLCSGFGALTCIFLLGILIVLQSLNYPVIGLILLTVGMGLITSAITLLCFSLIKRKKVERDEGNHTKNMDSSDDMEDFQDDMELQNPQVKERKYIWKRDMCEQDWQTEQLSVETY